MTKTISVPRDLLERIVGKCSLSALGDDHARVWELLAAAPKAEPQPVSDEVEKDAARYRWLCEYGYFRAMSMDMGGNHSWTGAGRHIGKGVSIDAAIDAAMGEKHE